MKRYHFLLIAALLILLNCLTAFAQEKWQLRKDKEGIQVFSAEVEGSSIRAIKVIASYEATPAQIVAVVMDVNTAKQWVSHLKSSILLKQISPNELYYYSEVNLPWPATNRDFVAHLTAWHDKETNQTIVDGPAVSGFVPEKKGIVRISNSTGRWVITPINQGE